MNVSPHREAFNEILKDPKTHFLGILNGHSLAGGTLVLKEVYSSQPSLPESDLLEHCLGTWGGWIRATVEYRTKQHLPSGKISEVVLSGKISVDVPWITTWGTFFLHGLEYVPVVQLLARPGIVFQSKVSRSGLERTVRADIVPEHGWWIRLWTKVPEHEPPQEVEIVVSPKKIEERIAGEGKSFRLGHDGRRRLNDRISQILPDVVTGTDEWVAPVDIEAARRCVEKIARERETAGMARVLEAHNPANLDNVRAFTIADQLRRALRDSLIDVEVELKQGMSKRETEERRRNDTIAILERCIGKRVSRLFGDSRMLQLVDKTNPLAELSHVRKATRRGPNGIKTEQASPEYRDLDESHEGRLCPYETPESELIGLNLHLARNASVEKEEIFREKPRKGESAQPEDALGSAAAMIPFLLHNDAPRALAGAKNMKQAVPLLAPESPLVRTGAESEVAARIETVLRAPVKGIVTEVRPDSIVLQVEGPEGDLEESCCPFRPRHPGPQGTPAGLTPRVKEGDEVEANQVLAAHASVDRNGELALGTNLLVAYLSYRGLNFEDGIVASDRLVSEGILTSLHLKRVRVELEEDEMLVAGRADPDEEFRPKWLDQSGIVKPGVLVADGDEIARTFKRETLWRTPPPEDESSTEAASTDGPAPAKPPAQTNQGTAANSVAAPTDRPRMMVPYEGHMYECRRIRHKAQPGQEGVVERVIKHTGQGDAVRIIEIWLRSKRPLQTGDKLMGRHGNKGVVTKILPIGEMPFIPSLNRHADLVLNPVSPFNRKNLGQLIETHIGLVAKERPDLIPPSRVFPACRPVDRKELNEWLGELHGSKLVDRTGKTKVVVQVPEKNEAGEVKYVERETELPVVVGYQYFLKLNHLAKDKIAFRAVGPQYGRVTKQPLRGRRFRGGQRWGEMEAWVLKAWNTPFLLEELLTAKSDDVALREALREFATSGLDPDTAKLGKPFVPESIRVLTNLFAGLGFNLRAYGQTAKKEESSPTAAHTHDEVSVFDPACKASEICHMDLSPFDDDALIKALARRAGGRAPVPRGTVGDQLQAVLGRDLLFSANPIPRLKRFVTLACKHEGLFEDIVDATRPPPRRKGRKKTKSGKSSGVHICRLCVEAGKPFNDAKCEVVAERESILGDRGGLYDPKIWGADDTGDAWNYRLAVIDLGGTVAHPLTRKNIRYVPVVPPAIRWSTDVGYGRLPKEGNLDRFYIRLLLATENLSVTVRVLDRCTKELEEAKQGKNTKAIAKAQQAVREAENAKNAFTSKIETRLFELVNNGLLPKVGGRKGFFRRYIVGKRVDFSGRAVIVGDPNLGVDQCGLPLRVAIEVLRGPLEEQLSEAIQAGIPKREDVLANLRNQLPRIDDNEKLLELLRKDYRLSIGRLQSAMKVPRDKLLEHLKPTLVPKPLHALKGLRSRRYKDDQLAPGRRIERLLEAIGRALPDPATIAAHVLREALLPVGDRTLDACLEEADVSAMEVRDKLKELGSNGVVLGDTPTEVIMTLCRVLAARHETTVLLNRAPSLHRYNVQAFKPVIQRDEVISISPLVCGSFNADFDGDTMAVHFPVRGIAIKEAREKLLPSLNKRSVAAGQSLVHITREMLAGLAAFATAESKRFEDTFGAEVSADKKSGMLVTGTGQSFADWVRQQAADAPGGDYAWRAMNAGFDWATSKGLSAGFLDIPETAPEPPNADELSENKKELSKARLSLWIDQVDHLGGKALALFARSGALRDPATLRDQLSAQYGSLQTLSGKDTDVIESNVTRGFTPRQVIWACRGARKSLGDMKLVTAVSGDFSRRMAWAAERIWIAENDCRTNDGIEAIDMRGFDKDENMETVLSRTQWVAGRSVCPDSTHIRSPLTCRSVLPGSLCAACYGDDLSTGERVIVGARVGFIAAQTIGERGTQLALRTFHGGGISGFDITKGLPRVIAVFEGWQTAVPNRNGESAWAAVAVGKPGFREGASFEELALPEFAGSDPGKGLTALIRIFLYEMYSNYKPDEISAKHFEVMLLAIFRALEVKAERQGVKNGVRRGEFLAGLTKATKDSLTPLEGMAFRDARGWLRTCAKEDGIEFDTRHPPLDRMLGIRQ